MGPGEFAVLALPLKARPVFEGGLEVVVLVAAPFGGGMGDAKEGRGQQQREGQKQRRNGGAAGEHGGYRLWFGAIRESRTSGGLSVWADRP